VDEAYQLASDREGKKVLDFILPLAESFESEEYGKIVWVFAGYKKEMEKLFEHNQELPSRFPIRFVFDDYKEEELQSIFEDLMRYRLAPTKRQLRDHPFRCETRDLLIAIRRLGRRRGSIVTPSTALDGFSAYLEVPRSTSMASFSM
jgi:hypothetical protein